MQSKEEIENILKDIRQGFRKIPQVENILYPLDINQFQKLSEYIIQLETQKQEVIEKLEERIQSVEKCYNEMLSDVGGIKIINVSGLSRKEKEEVVNKRNCLLVQKHCYEEILEILKGEKQ